MVRGHPDERMSVERPPWWRTGYGERPLWWKTGHPDKRLWWGATLIKDPLRLEAILIKEWLSWETILIKDWLLGETTLMKEYLLWETTLMKGWLLWETTLMKGWLLWETTLMKDLLCDWPCFCWRVSHNIGLLLFLGEATLKPAGQQQKNTHLAYKYMVKPDVQQPTVKIDFVGLKIILWLLLFCQEIILHIKPH